MQSCTVEKKEYSFYPNTTVLKLLSPVLKKVWCEYEYEYGLGVSMVWGVVFPGP